MSHWVWVLGCSGGTTSPQGEPVVPQPSALVAPSPRVSMVVAARDLPPGHVVAADDVHVIEVSVDLKPKSAPSDVDAVVGQAVQAGIWEHQPFIPQRFDPSRIATLKPGATERTLTLPELTWAIQHGDLLDVLRTPSTGPCVAVPSLFVMRTDDDAHTTDVVASEAAMATLDAIPRSERTVLLRGFRAEAPPLPPCGDRP